MKNIDEQIHQHLTTLNIPHTAPPYTHLQNNNEAITDNKNFFIKLNTNPRGLQIELETSLHLPFAPKPLHPTLIQNNNTYIFITQYIQSTPVTPNAITEKDIHTIFHQLKQIQTLNQNIYTNPRKLSETINLINTRLQTPQLTPQQHNHLNTLINLYIKPYIQKYENSTTLAHTDLHLKNILKKQDGTVFLIDYEGIKPSPIEADLAGLYQTLNQNNQQKLYQQFENIFKTEYPTLNYETLTEAILFKNTLTTTAAVRMAPEILDERIQIMLNTIPTKQPAPHLPPVV